MILIHTQKLSDCMDLVRSNRPEYIKAIDPDVESAKECESLGVKLIVRHNGAWDNEDYIDPGSFVNNCASQPWFPYAWAVETPNEPHPGDADWMAAVVAGFEQLRKVCVVGNWGTGWDGFYVEGADYYGTHEYGWPTLTSQMPYQALRHQEWFEQEVLTRNPNAKLFITECGVTQMVLGREDIGWRSGDIFPWEYAYSLSNYHNQLRSYVIGMMVFQFGVYSPWETFDCLGVPELEALLSGQSSDNQNEGDTAVNQAQMNEINELASIARNYQKYFGALADVSEGTYGNGFVDTVNRRREDEMKGFADRISNLPNL
jgi:hypothetical protein